MKSLAPAPLSDVPFPTTSATVLHRRRRALTHGTARSPSVAIRAWRRNLSVVASLRRARDFLDIRASRARDGPKALKAVGTSGHLGRFFGTWWREKGFGDGDRQV